MILLLDTPDPLALVAVHRLLKLYEIFEGHPLTVEEQQELIAMTVEDMFVNFSFEKQHQLYKSTLQIIGDIEQYMTLSRLNVKRISERGGKTYAIYVEEVRRTR